jgi:hypothetical protein
MLRSRENDGSFGRRAFKRINRDEPQEPEESRDNERMKYMESYLAKDKKYIPYEKYQQHQAQLMARAKAENDADHTGRNILIGLVAVVVIVIALVQGGVIQLPT